MSNICSLEKLKGTVNVPLPKYGELLVYAPYMAGSQISVSILFGKNDTNVPASVPVYDSNMEIVGNIAQSSTYYYKMFTIIAGSLPQTAAYVGIPNKYDIVGVQALTNSSTYPTPITINMQDLQYSPIENITFDYRDPSINPTNLSVYKAFNNTLKDFTIRQSSKTEGSIVELGTCKILKSLNVAASTKIVGNLEDFCVAQHSASTTTRKITLTAAGSNVKFHNNSISAVIYIGISLNNITVGTTDGGSELGTWNGSTWSYS